MTFEIRKSRITHGILLTFQTVFLIFFYYYYNATSYYHKTEQPSVSWVS